MTVDVVRIQNDLAYARNCYIDYKKNGSASGITEDDFQIIEDNWSRYFSTWDAYMNSQDENGYTIVDDDYDGAVGRGVQKGKDQTGYDDSTWDETKQVGRSVQDGLETVGKGANAVSTGSKIVKGASTIKSAKGIKDGLSKMNLVNWKVWISCALDFAIALAYRYSKPNEDPKKALDVIEDNMDDLQSQSKGAQNDVEKAGKVVKRSAEEAAKANESANAEMAKSKTDYAMYQRAYEYLQSEQTRGTFDEEDAANYEECVRNMTDKGKDIDEQKTMAEETVGEKYEDMKGQESAYDNAKEDIGEVEGVTDYAEGFDTLTKNNCTVTKWTQYLNAATACVDAIAAAACFVVDVVSQWWAAALDLAAGVAAGFAAVWSFQAATEQGEWADEIGVEITDREATQDLNEGSKELCEEKTEDYKEYLADTENLELVIPDGVDAPTDTSPAPVDGEDGGDDGDGDGPRKKPEE